MDDLQICYQDMTHLLGAYAEPLESVLLVDRYRQFWRPKKIRIILLAESHVFTSDIDRQCSVPEIEDLPGYPQEYAKFVYCLSYGEDSLKSAEKYATKDGTPQFWKIFFSCNNTITSNASFAPILKSATDTNERIANKIQLLKELQARGIWLVDVSIMALYNDSKKPSGNIMARALQTSWSGYTRRIIEDAAPEHVIVIGKGVANIVETDLKRIMGSNYSVIAQPNAHLSAEAHLDNFKKYNQLCGVVCDE